MHSSIRQFPSLHFYDNRLIDAPHITSTPQYTQHLSSHYPIPPSLTPPPGKIYQDIRLGPYVLLDARGGQEQIHNKYECCGGVCAECL